MRDGLAWRWIASHAGAFTCNWLAYRFMIWLYPEPLAYYRSWTVTVMTAFVAAGVLGLAQTAALWKQAFPVSPARWWTTTAGGVLVGRLALMGLGWTYSTLMARLINAHPELLRIFNGLIRAVFAATAGMLLGLIQALVLRCAVPHRLAILWMTIVGGAWLGADLAVWGLWSLLDWSVSLPAASRSGVGFLTAGAEGALFAVLTLPALRRVLAEAHTEV